MEYVLVRKAMSYQVLVSWTGSQYGFLECQGSWGNKSRHLTWDSLPSNDFCDFRPWRGVMRFR